LHPTGGPIEGTGWKKEIANRNDGELREGTKRKRERDKRGDERSEMRRKIGGASRTRLVLLPEDIVVMETLLSEWQEYRNINGMTGDPTA